MAAVRLICGVDEAGRGPLAGPVCAAAVIFSPGRRRPAGIADSKVLSVSEREPHEVLLDGSHCPELAFPVRAIVDGDARVKVIAAASILAKTERDAEMCRLHLRFPQYGFDEHKGYPTRAHLRALRRHGVCEVYRRSFRPVRLLLENGR